MNLVKGLQIGVETTLSILSAYDKVIFQDRGELIVDGGTETSIVSVWVVGEGDAAGCAEVSRKEEPRQTLPGAVPQRREYPRPSWIGW